MNLEYRPTMGRKMKEVLEDLTFRQKVQYIWRFYKLYILAVLSPLIVLAGALGWSALTKTETLFNGIGVCVSVEAEGEKFLTDSLFAPMGGTNNAKQQVNFGEYDIFSTNSVMGNDDASSNVMSIAAWLSVGEVDYMLLNEDSFEYYAGDIFWDLEELLSEEMQAIWRDRFEEMQDENEKSFYGAIDLTDTAFAKKYITTEGKVYIAIPGKALRTDKLETFLNHLLSVEE